ncbi:tRNA pseudouridine(55) synthase TruB [Myxococcota bacterium]|nr:tRNA pseudouridine(55) synthase TruB [Myxococcota bacterium]
MDGILVIDKPVGPTSHDVVAIARKALNMKKVGHTGTLDPAATGVLPLVLGQGTKIAQYLSGDDKTYEAVIRLGITTTTLDREGEVTSQKEVNVDKAAILQALEPFRGEIEQTPPMYSAKKLDGQPLYKLARKGVEVERKAKKIVIYELELLEMNLPDISVRVRCSAGTYIRVLAEDLGEKLGCGAYLAELRRTQAGVFTLADAVELEELRANPDLASAKLMSPVQVLSEFPVLKMPVGLARKVGLGHQLTVADLRELDLPVMGTMEVLTLQTDDGQLIAVAKPEVDFNDLNSYRREHRGIKTDRVFLRI